VSDIKDVGEYCREIETYLCQKNDGHLIRIVGPAFEQVSGWAARGVPLKIAFRGIDRYCERYYAKGRRRPVRIEFCEADILDAFDDWRRAVGVAAGNGTTEPARKPSLVSHIERVAARLTSLQGDGTRAAELIEEIGRAVRELDALKGDALNARGERRKEIVAELERIDRAIVEAAGRGVNTGAAAALEREAEAELTPFAARMTGEAYAAAKRAAYARLLRDVAGLPVVRYE
jgi:hypothetical protein